ncbi:CK1 family protein kinase [Tritrichomonas foetus]|uniref:non-specific serine/threonine protein kinase n=1 Tax=Tritrichomonas foetus TaxID=1144522 RepID=A0A1J4J6E6_9EUKA|nr:CK1 family protein kinase [Tritrichomonas foetus]|eukprot:OHS92748.1 CK1 family protein kinase [Tritrichomonas foetus]
MSSTERIVGNHYRLRRRIGAGSFGEIYSAENIRSHRKVAVKLENMRTKVPQLSYESKLYSIFSGGTGIPRLHWYGTEDCHNVMVIDLLGKSLEDLFVMCRRKLSLKTVLMIADQMISCIEYIHSKNFIHRDIKPDNFVMGIGSNSNQVFVIDYGLSKKYRDQHTHNHIPYVEGKSLTGTARYASVGALRGVEQSRRDDMESLGYVWLYLLRGDLPWMGLNGRNQQDKYDRICDVKAKTPFTKLCDGFPEEFVKYFTYVRNLRFTEKPNYSELRKMFRDLFNKLGYVYDYKYDWILPPSSLKAIKPNPSLGRIPVPPKREPMKDANNHELPGSTLVRIQSVPYMIDDGKHDVPIRTMTANKRRIGHDTDPRRNIYTAKNPPPNSALIGKTTVDDSSSEDEKEREKERMKILEREKEKERERKREFERAKEKAKEREREREKEREREREKEKEKEKDRIRAKDRDGEQKAVPSPLAASKPAKKSHTHHKTEEKKLSSRKTTSTPRGSSPRRSEEKTEEPVRETETDNVKAKRARKPLYHI